MPYPWSAGNVLTATDLNSSLAAKYDSAPAINAQTGTAYTFVLADATAGKTITASNASASTYTVPPQSSVAFSAGALLRVTNLGAGVVTFAGGVGVTVTNTAGTLAQYQTATLVRTGADAWTVIPAGGASGLTLVATATASASSAVSINSCFTSLYENYLLVIASTFSANGVNFNFRLRASGTDASGTDYSDNSVYSTHTAGPSRSYANGQTSTQFGWAADGSCLFVANIARPNAAVKTTLAISGNSWGSAAAMLWTAASTHNLSTAYDGFSVFPASGTFTTPANGIRVYGYKNT